MTHADRTYRDQLLLISEGVGPTVYADRIWNLRYPPGHPHHAPVARGLRGKDWPYIREQWRSTIGGTVDITRLPQRLRSKK